MWVLASALASCPSFEVAQVRCQVDAQCPGPGRCLANGFCAQFGGEGELDAGGPADAGGVADAGPVDAGGRDAGFDGGVPDGGVTDAGAFDAATPSDGGSDAGSADAAVSDAGFCAQLQPAPVFCVDFDQPTALDVFGTTSMQQAAASLDGGVWAVEASAVSSGVVEANGLATLAPVVGKVRTFEFDVVFDELPTQVVPVTIYPDHSDSYAEVVFNPTNLGVCEHNGVDGGGVCLFANGGLALGQWHHVRFRLDYGSGVGTLNTKRGGVDLPDASVSIPLALGSPMPEPVFAVGLVNLTLPVTSRLAYRLDNVTFDTK